MAKGKKGVDNKKCKRCALDCSYGSSIRGEKPGVKHKYNPNNCPKQ